MTVGPGSQRERIARHRSIASAVAASLLVAVTAGASWLLANADAAPLLAVPGGATAPASASLAGAPNRHPLPKRPAAGEALETAPPSEAAHPSALLASLLAEYPPVRLGGGDLGSPSPAVASASRTHNGRPIRPGRTIRMLVTGYSPDERSCGIWADGITASLWPVETNGGRLVAADTRLLPFGSLVSVAGYGGGAPVPVLDRGGAIKGNRLDLLFPTHEKALEWGRRWIDVVVWEYADGRGIEFKRPSRRARR